MYSRVVDIRIDFISWIRIIITWQLNAAIRVSITLSVICQLISTDFCRVCSRRMIITSPISNRTIWKRNVNRIDDFVNSTLARGHCKNGRSVLQRDHRALFSVGGEWYLGWKEDKSGTDRANKRKSWNGRAKGSRSVLIRGRRRRSGRPQCRWLFIIRSIGISKRYRSDRRRIDSSKGFN